VTDDGLFEELTGLLGSRREARWVLEELDVVAPDARRDRARSLAERRRSGEPLQYVLGHWPFHELDLAVDGRALIPRPVERGDGAVVCDLGCGTGAIALSVAVVARRRGLDVTVVATDVSRDALDLAHANAERTGAMGVSFLEGRWYDALPERLRGRVDVLCSNPPYVAAAERLTLARELDFEPELALVSADGSESTPGFADVEAVVVGALAWLAPGGTLLVEHGATQGTAATACAARAGLTVVADHDDLAGLPRLLQARRP
jgi:release factor glutamine methyltransferase